MYEKLYHKYLPTDARRQGAEKKSERLLEWALYSMRPLKSCEISPIISGNFMEEGSSQTYLPRSCRSFVFESERNEIEISHSSVREYLVLKLSDRLEAYKNCSEYDREQLLKDAHHDSQFRCNVRISVDCLSCLSSTDKSKMTSESSPRPPLFQYAAENWVNHIKKTTSAGSIPDVILQPLLNLFHRDQCEAFRNWLFISNPEYQHLESPQKKAELTINPEPLYYAILLGLSPLVEAIFVQQVSDVNSSGGLYGSCLQLAAFLGDGKLVEDLISRDAKVDAPGGIFGSVLQAAAAGGHSEIVASLLSNPLVQPHASGGLLGNALQAALARGADEIVPLLVASGISFNPNRGRLWKAAYDELTPTEKSGVSRIVKPTARLPKLTELQALLAHMIGFSSELELFQARSSTRRYTAKLPKSSPNVRFVYSFYASPEFELIKFHCRRGNLDDMGFLYQTLPFVGIATILITAASTVGQIIPSQNNLCSLGYS